MFFVIMVLIILTSLSFAFHQFSREAQNVAFRFQQKAVARQLAEAALEEAFMRLYNATADPSSSQEGKWLTGSRTGAISIAVPTTTKIAPKLITTDANPEIKVLARCVDFRNNDSRGAKYLPNEGVGTLELVATVNLKHKSLVGKKNNTIAACTIIRHHDFKVVTIVSARDNRNPRPCYAHNFVLDYVLLVRAGLKEFRQTNGYSLNTDTVRLTISQDDLFKTPEKLGKIYIGGTDDPGAPSSAAPNETPKGNYVFLNVDEANKALIPAFKQEGFYRIGLDDCVLLFPDLKEYKSDLKGLEGVFCASNEPLVKEDTKYEGSKIAKTELAALNGVASCTSGADRNLLPGMNLISKNPAIAAIQANAEAIFEGAIRQRFLYFVYFFLDFSKVKEAKSKHVQKLKDDIMPCVPLSNPPPKDDVLKAFYEGLQKLNQKRPPNIPPLISSYNADFLYKGGQTGAIAPQADAFKTPPPIFFTSDGQKIDFSVGNKDARPFCHINLYYRRLQSAKQLEEIGIYDPKNGILNLRGIVQILDSVTLGKQDLPSIKVKGRGVLIAKNFHLLSGIEKDSNSPMEPICILYARKESISIDTNAPIHASIIALGTGDNYLGLYPSKPLKLCGSLAVDMLNLNKWSVLGENTIAYDPILKSPKDNIFQIIISHTINFQRVLENTNDEEPKS